jgi:hypothetical protein
MDQRGQNSRALIGPGMSGSRVMSRAEAAAYCGCTVVGFSDWVRRGIVPALFQVPANGIAKRSMPPLTRRVS